MAREIQIISTSDGTKYIEFGWDADELASFSLQMYITKTGARAVDFLQSLSLSFMSFMGGNLYLHNSDDAPRATLFGEKKDVKVGIVANEQGGTAKLLDSIALGTDGIWEEESVTIPPDNNHPYGMYSTIPKGNFKKREGMLYSEFLRNQKTTGSTAKVIEALTGEQLRAREAYIILKNTSANKVQLYSVELNMTKSR